MQNRNSIRVLIAIAAVPAIFLAGCGTRGAQKLITQRLDNLHQTVMLAEKREAERPEKINRLLGLLAQRHERDVAQIGYLPTELERILQQEADRWEQNLPSHERCIREKLQGNIGNIERTLPKMLF